MSVRVCFLIGFLGLNICCLAGQENSWESHLLAAGLTSKRRKARRDRVAAQILLQSYIDAGCPPDPKPMPLN